MRLPAVRAVLAAAERSGELTERVRSPPSARGLGFPAGFRGGPVLYQQPDNTDSSTMFVSTRTAIRSIPAMVLLCHAEPMFGQFSDQARRAVVSSREESRRLSHHYIGSEHLLLALISQRETQAGKALAAAGLTLSGAREEVERLTGRGRERSPGHLPFTAHVKTILETATYAAQRRRQNSLTPEHLLLALLLEDEGRGARVVRELGADPALLLEQATALSDTTPPTSDDDLTSRVSALEEQVNALTEQVTELRRRLGA